MEFSPTFLIWAPIALLFLSAIVSAIVNRNSKDHCLKHFNGSFVVIRMKNGQFLWGTLNVYPDCLELIYSNPIHSNSGASKASYILYNKKIAEIDRIYRPAPDTDASDFELWTQEISCVRKPSVFRKLKRSIRNAYSILHDAFSQSLNMVVGMAKQSSKSMQELSTSDKRANEVGQSLMKILPNAYEPVLEKYLGSQVVVESILNGTIDETIGVLQDYSISYLIIRASAANGDLPPEASQNDKNANCCDVIFPRGLAVVRHRLVEALA